MKKIDFKYLADDVFAYEYMGMGSGDWNYYMKFKLHDKYSISAIEKMLIDLPLIDECEIHLHCTRDIFELRVIWNDKIMWSGQFMLYYHGFNLYDTDFAEYLEDRINEMK